MRKEIELKGELSSGPTGQLHFVEEGKSRMQVLDALVQQELTESPAGRIPRTKVTIKVSIEG